MKSTPNKTIVGIMTTFARGGPATTGSIMAIRVSSPKICCVDDETDKR
jgi:hypothetical protein